MGEKIKPGYGDILFIVDVQNDFLPGGSLAVPHGDEVVPVLNHYLKLFKDNQLPVYASRDWHPPDHCSFISQGGQWPPHCIQNSSGAEFSEALHLPSQTFVVSKASDQWQDAYSAFQSTGLVDKLKNAGVKRLFVGGLATDYCVLSTVNDALKAGFQVYLLCDAIRAVNLQFGDGDRAIHAMEQHGARLVQLSEFIA